MVCLQTHQSSKECSFTVEGTGDQAHAPGKTAQVAPHLQTVLSQLNHTKYTLYTCCYHSSGLGWSLTVYYLQ